MVELLFCTYKTGPEFKSYITKKKETAGDPAVGRASQDGTTGPSELRMDTVLQNDLAVHKGFWEKVHPKL